MYVENVNKMAIHQLNNSTNLKISTTLDSYTPPKGLAKINRLN